MLTINDYLNTLTPARRSNVEGALNKLVNGVPVIEWVKRLHNNGLKKYVTLMTKGGKRRKRPLIEYALWDRDSNKIIILERSSANLINYLHEGRELLKEEGTLEKAHAFLMNDGANKLDLDWLKAFFSQFNRRLEFHQDMKEGTNLDKYSDFLLLFYETYKYTPTRSAFEGIAEAVDSVKEARAAFEDTVSAKGAEARLIVTLSNYNEELTAADITLQFSSPSHWAQYTCPSFVEPCSINDAPAVVLGSLLEPLPLDGQFTLDWNEGLIEVKKMEALEVAMQDALETLVHALHTGGNPVERWKINALLEAGIFITIE